MSLYHLYNVADGFTKKKLVEPLPKEGDIIRYSTPDGSMSIREKVEAVYSWSDEVVIRWSRSNGEPFYGEYAIGGKIVVSLENCQTADGKPFMRTKTPAECAMELRQAIDGMVSED